MKNLFLKKIIPVFLSVFALLISTGCEEKQSLPKLNKVQTADDLGGATIGVQLGTTGDIYASDYVGKDSSKIDVQRFNKASDAILSLIQSKLDAVIIDEHPAEAFVEQNPELTILNEEFVKEDYAGVVAKERLGFLDSINSAIKELKSSGTLDKILATYIDKTENYHCEQSVKEGIPLVWATNAQFPPYEFYENNIVIGIDKEIGCFIADKLGRVLKVEDMEFDAIIGAVSSGKADIGLAGFTVTEERKKSINFTDVYTTSKQVIVVRKAGVKKSKNKIQSIKTLGGSTVGVQLGTTGDLYATDYVGEDSSKIDVHRFNKGTDAVQALLQSKLDGVIIDEQVALAFVGSDTRLKVLQEEFVREDYAAVIAKGHESLLDSVNLAIREMQANGMMKRIEDTYIAKTDSFKYTQKVTEGPQFVMATNAQFPPYEYYDKNEIVGYEVEMAKFIADKLGRVLKIEDMEFDAVIGAVSSGKADIGFSGFTVTEERKKSIHFTDIFTQTKQVVIVRNDVEADVQVEETFMDHIHKDFVKDNRWKYIAEGLSNTLIISLLACLGGVLIGFLVSLVRFSHEMHGSFKILNKICKIYLAIIRGTPMMVQLLIIYYIVFASVDINKIFVAVVAFSINSGAYVAEIFRGGFKSVDPGQLEAGVSLGLRFRTIVKSVILPQAFKNSLPALTNEFISLIKETSICGYIGLMDLTRGGDIIRSITYEAFYPLIAVAIVYFIIVAGLTSCVSRLEKSLKKDER